MNEQQQQPADDDFSAEVMETLGFSSGDTDPLDKLDFSEPPAGGESTAPAEAGSGVDAPSPDPVTPLAASEAQPSPAAPEPAAATPAETPPVAPTPQPAAEPVQPPSAEVLRAQSLEAQVQALQAQIEQLRSQPAGQQGQPGTPAAESGDQPPVVRYNLTLPDALMEAIDSDDPTIRKQGITSMVNDIGMIIHNRVMGDVRKSLNDLVSIAATDDAAQQHAQDMAAKREEYFNVFPKHNTPTHHALVAAESQKLSTEYPHLPWGKDFINALGARVNAAITALSGQSPAVEPTPTPTPEANAPPAKPARMLPQGGPRGDNTGVPVEGEDLILDTLSGFSPSA